MKIKNLNIVLDLPFNELKKQMPKLAKATVYKTLMSAKADSINDMLTKLHNPTKFTANQANKKKPGAGSSFVYSKVKNNIVEGALTFKDKPSEYLKGVITNQGKPHKEAMPLVNFETKKGTHLKLNKHGNVPGERRIIAGSTKKTINGDTYLFGKRKQRKTKLNPEPKTTSVMLYKVVTKEPEMVYDFYKQATQSVNKALPTHYKDEITRLIKKLK